VKKYNKSFIAKPEAGAQGSGIFLITSPAQIPKIEKYVVQRYLAE
jgi:glutathione synthase/RimK-type ligase-like ATP-grasp enzyme